jgi:dihydroflavonol-4-reductase
MTEPLPTVAVTGISGLLGGALTRRLLADGYPVRGLLRTVDPSWEAMPGISVIPGDLSDTGALGRLVAGADTVFHIAAMYRSDGPWEDFAEANWHGTERLLAAAAGAGVRRFVYCSTIGVHGSVAASPGNEDAPFDPRDNYQRSKLHAEEACRAAMGGNMEIVILRPCGIYGPGDLRMLKLFRMLQKRMFVQIGKGEANFHPVYIDDLVDGFMLGMTVEGVAGETFIIGGADYLPLKDYVATAAAALPAPPPRLHLPYKPMETAARLCETICAPFGVQPPLHQRRLTFFKHNRAFSIDRARTKLGYAPRITLPEGFKRTVQWYRQERLL